MLLVARRRVLRLSIGGKCSLTLWVIGLCRGGAAEPNARGDPVGLGRLLPGAARASLLRVSFALVEPLAALVHYKA